MSARRCKCGRPIEERGPDADMERRFHSVVRANEQLGLEVVQLRAWAGVLEGLLRAGGCELGPPPDDPLRATGIDGYTAKVDRPAARPQPRTIVKPPGDPSTDRASRPLRCRLGLHRWDFETWELRPYPWTEPLRCSLCGRTKR